jgi:hypothetical protein
MRRFLFVLMVMAFALPALAQDGNGWSFSGHFQGSSNSSGLVTKIDPTLGYGFNKHFQMYVGVPFYMVKESATTTTTTLTQTPGSFLSGIGNAYVGLGVVVNNDMVNFASTLEGTAPTGDRDKGFSTGRATVDWTNTLSHKFSSLTPFASVGLANSVSDTSFFLRPFTSLGLVSHFDGGVKYALSPVVDFGASTYAVRASGDQRIISKVFKRAAATSTTLTSRKSRVFDTTGEVLGGADLSNDYGFSTWVAAHAGSNVDLQVGYTRSGGYDLNTLFFGVGFRVGH